MLSLSVKRLWTRTASSYEALPTSRSTSPSKPTSNRWRIFVTVLLLLVASTSGGVIWMWTRLLSRSACYVSTPLDSIEHVPHGPLVSQTSPSLHSTRAVASSLYSDSFAMAVAVLGYSIHSANMTTRLILPYLSDRVSDGALCIARTVGWEPQPIPFIPPPLAGIGVHDRFRDQYTKLNIWGLDKQGIDRLVYLDADTLVRRNFEELFDLPFNFAAVGDVYAGTDPRAFAITFNAGVLALKTSSSTLEDMREKIYSLSYPRQTAEQGFLNVYYGATVNRLPYVYNANLAIKSRNPSLWAEMNDEMRIVHYTIVKPFLHSLDKPQITLPSEIEEAMKLASEAYGGYYADEVGWWKDAYEGMTRDKGAQINRCLSL